MLHTGPGVWLWEAGCGLTSRVTLAKSPSPSELLCPLSSGKEVGLCVSQTLFPIQGLACLAQQLVGLTLTPPLSYSSKVFRSLLCRTATHCQAEISSGSRCGETCSRNSSWRCWTACLRGSTTRTSSPPRSPSSPSRYDPDSLPPPPATRMQAWVTHSKGIWWGVGESARFYSEPYLASGGLPGGLEDASGALSIAGPGAWSLGPGGGCSVSGCSAIAEWCCAYPGLFTQGGVMIS